MSVLPDLVQPPVWVVEDGHDYLTERIWDLALPPLDVIGANPGTAQPTTSTYVGQYIERVTRLAVRDGFGGLRLFNHWTVAESNSTRALAAPVKIGPRADEFLDKIREQPGVPLLGTWGNDVAEVDDLCGWRVRTLIKLAAECDRQVLCVGVTSAGQPRHLSSFRPFVLDDVQLLEWPTGTPWAGVR